MPHDLVDNAAIVGTISLVTAALFLLDMGGPKAKKKPTEQKLEKNKRSVESGHRKSITQQVYDIEREIEKSEKKNFDTFEKVKPKSTKEMNGHKNGTKNGLRNENGIEMEPPKSFKGVVENIVRILN